MKILILGTGSAQYDAIRWCRDAGHEVHGCGLARVGLGVGELDRFFESDVRDIDRVAGYCREHGIELVYSVGSDIAMPTVGAVSARLGLRHFVPESVAAVCQDKGRLREALGPDFEWNVVHAVAASPVELARWDRFPCIIKPVDSQGQRGVHACHGHKELAARFAEAAAFSRAGRVIVEELIEGQEISVNVHIAGGAARFLQTSDRFVYEDQPGGLVREHRVPSRVAGADEVGPMVNETVRRLGISDGPVYFQAKIGERGLRLLEVTPRLDGCHLWRLIRYSTGLDLLEAAFRHLLDGAAPDLPPPSWVRPGALRFLSERPGVRVDRGAFDPGRPDFLQWYYSQGEEVRPVNGHFEKVGYLVEME